MRFVLFVVSLLAVGCATRPLSFGDPGGTGGGGRAPSDGGAPGGDTDLARGDSVDMRPAPNADMRPAPNADMADGGSDTGSLFYPYSTIAFPGQLDDTDAIAVAIGDVTNDGRADVVVLAQNFGASVNQIFVYPQSPTGTLGALTSVPLLDNNINEAALALGDVNGDGLLDVVATGRNTVAVLYQNPGGGFAPAQALTPSQPNAQLATVAVADFNGDGLADVAASGYQSGVDVWYQAGGTLGAPVNFACGAGAFAVTAVGDFDGDGRLDVAVNGEEATNGCLLLQRPGGFAPAITLSYGNTPESIGAGDLNGDGRAELIAVGGGNRPESYIGVASLSADATAMGTFNWMTSYDIPGAVVVTDIDGDNRADAVVLHIGWDAVGLYRQQLDGTLGAEELVDFAYVNWGPNHMAVGDINGDGRPDIVAADYGLFVMLHR